MTNNAGEASNFEDWRDAILNLPTVRTLKEQIGAFEALARAQKRPEIIDELALQRKELQRIIDVAGNFYNLLGNRNWVLSGYLNLPQIEKIINVSSAEQAEHTLIEYLKDEGTLLSIVMRLHKFPDMRPRIPLLEKAVNDFLEGRYYSSTLVVVSMMDGFVNDVRKDERKGLHARTSEEMTSPDSLATIPIGLPSLQKIYTKKVSRVIKDEVTDVYRNGLMHGMITNFDNPVIAAKAWLMLFAVCDWAEDKYKDRENEKLEDKGFAEVLNEYKEQSERLDHANQRLSEWKSHEVNLVNPDEYDIAVLEDCVGFFEAWKKENYGKLGTFLPNFTNASSKKMAGEAREIYSKHPIDSYEIIGIDRTAASIAMVKVNLRYEDKVWSPEIKFIKRDGAIPIADWESETWTVARHGIAPFKG